MAGKLLSTVKIENNGENGLYTCRNWKWVGKNWSVLNLVSDNCRYVLRIMTHTRNTPKKWWIWLKACWIHHILHHRKVSWSRVHRCFWIYFIKSRVTYPEHTTQTHTFPLLLCSMIFHFALSKWRKSMERNAIEITHSIPLSVCIQCTRTHTTPHHTQQLSPYY